MISKKQDFSTFPKIIFPSGIFPSCNFQTEQFPKSVLAAALDPLACSSRSARHPSQTYTQHLAPLQPERLRRPNITVKKLSLRKLNIGEMPLEKHQNKGRKLINIFCWQKCVLQFQAECKRTKAKVPLYFPPKTAVHCVYKQIRVFLMYISWNKVWWRLKIKNYTFISLCNFLSIWRYSNPLRTSRRIIEMCI